MADTEGLLRALTGAQVEFIIVGGVAAVVHGASQLTLDLDLVYGRGEENLRRLAQALAPYHPYPRGAPPGLPFLWDVATLRAGLNFTLSTDLGALDLFGELPGVGDYQACRVQSVAVELFGSTCWVLGLEALIRAKRAAGRPKDWEAVAELEAIREELSFRQSPKAS